MQVRWNILNTHARKQMRKQGSLSGIGSAVEKKKKYGKIEEIVHYEKEDVICSNWI